MNVVHVAAAAICSDDDILLSRRPDHAHQGGKWEFPGGKVEAGESVTDALIRELNEELGIIPTRFRPLIRVHHQYPDLSVLLDVWLVDHIEGEPVGCEGQEVEWVSRSRLRNLEFPQANFPIIQAVLLPPYLPDISFDVVEGTDYLVWANTGPQVDWAAFQAFTELALLPVYLSCAPSCATVDQ
ncbi:unnamed protein product, partial [Cyprideis torosa]